MSGPGAQLPALFIYQSLRIIVLLTKVRFQENVKEGVGEMILKAELWLLRSVFYLIPWATDQSQAMAGDRLREDYPGIILRVVLI